MVESSHQYYSLDGYTTSATSNTGTTSHLSEPAQAIPFIEMDAQSMQFTVSSEAMNVLGSLPRDKKVAPVIVCGSQQASVH